MGYTYYKLIALIPKEARVSFDEIYERLKRKFGKIEGVKLERPEVKHIQLRFNDWLFHLHLEDEPHVALESREIAATVVNKRADGDLIASSDKRITTYGMLDPDMEHFNDYVFVIEVLESVPQLYIFDPNDGKLWKSGETPPAN